MSLYSPFNLRPDLRVTKWACLKLLLNSPDSLVHSKNQLTNATVERSFFPNDI